MQQVKDQPAEELIRNLGNTESHLKILAHHLERLVGNGDPEDGQLAEWTNYQSRPGFLPDPGDIIDDLDFIASCLVMVKNRTSAMAETLPSSSFTPGEGSVVTSEYSQLPSHQSDTSLLLQRAEQVQSEQDQHGHETATPETYQCGQCQETFRQLPVLIRHKEVFHNPSSGPASLGTTPL